MLEHIQASQGNFIDILTGKIVGIHNGYFQYTIGQRKGIGIAAPEPLYVVDINAKENIVYVGNKQQLEKTELTLDNFNCSYSITKREFTALCKIRYNMQATEVSVKLDESKTTIKL